MKKFNEFLSNQMKLDYYQELMEFVNEEYETKTIYPPKELIFNAFNLVDLDDVKVVIIGQDPYHGYNQANGLAFSVNEGVTLPPSLRNIFLEMVADVGGVFPTHGDLTYLALQGVLLLNNVLTVPEGSPNEHKNMGWEHFVKNILLELNKSKHPIVFILWGRNAIASKKYIDSKHFTIEGVHPSPLSSYRGFFGSKPFSQTNEYLKTIGLDPIVWLEETE